MGNGNRQRKAEYSLNRVDMLRKLKESRRQLENIAIDGIKTKDDERIARIACSILAADYYFEESVMQDKTGEDGFSFEHLP